MIKILTNNNSGYKWYTNETSHAKGFVFDAEGNLYKDEKLLDYFSDIQDNINFEKKLSEANGQFAIIINQNGKLLAATDIIRSFPIFYKKEEEDITISDDIYIIINPETKIDENSKRIFRATGYVTGSATLAEKVSQIEAGQYISLEDNKLTIKFYHTFIQETEKKSFDEAKSELRVIMERVGKRLTKLLGDRPVAIPLSGGLDSRIIAFLLRENGYNNVKCFTYGVQKGNPELERARKVAETLGYNWTFIDYNLYKNTNFLDTEQFANYVDYASQFCSKFYFSEYFAAENLKNNLCLPMETVFIPGHSGDSISGSHLRPYMNNYHNIKIIAKNIQYSQFNLIDMSGEDRRKCTKEIALQLSRSNYTDYQVFENWIMKERQAKYIVNSCRIWEFHGYQYVLPLWDKELADFLIRQPFEYRLYQKLYRAVLKEWFSEKGLWFAADEKEHESDLMQFVKMTIKSIMPWLRRKRDLYAGDCYGFREITREMVSSLPHPEKIRSYNGIFTEWYIRRIKG